MRIIDAHTHIRAEHPDVGALLGKLDMKVLCICVAHEPGAWREQAEVAARLTEKFPQHYAWCTSFDTPVEGDFANCDYGDRVVEALQRDFAAGAIACKIHKAVGMKIKDPQGNFIQADHPIFEPVYECLTKAGKPLLAHLAEPISCWQPLPQGDAGPTQGYYKNHPEWHMYGRTDVPSHAEIMAARDRVVEKHPDMTFIGAHMASLESDLRGLAERLDKYPNFAIDTTRSYNMAIADGEEVRRFFTKYQDRIMFATDAIVQADFPEKTEAERKNRIDALRREWASEWTFHSSDAETIIEGRMVRGIDLPQELLSKLFYENACKWYPGIE